MKPKILLIMALLLCLPHTTSSKGASWQAGYLQDRQLDELSGLAASTQHNGIYWGINDSGNEPILFALNENGQARGKVRIHGILARDPEALGYGNCVFAPKCLYVADIGDNKSERRQVRIEVIAEPSPNVADVRPVQTIFLTYSDGAHDAEAMLVHPQTGDIFIVEKKSPSEVGANAQIFVVPRIVERSRQITRIARPISNLAQRSLNGDSAGPFTDASFSSTGREFFIRDYHDVYRVENNIGILQLQSLRPIPSPQMPQGEAIAVSQDNKRLVISSEGRHALITTIPIN